MNNLETILAILERSKAPLDLRINLAAASMYWLHPELDVFHPDAKEEFAILMKNIMEE